MTRINLVHPSWLTDQHLLAEYRELPRIVNSWRNKKDDNKFYDGIPKTYVFGKGHVKFFRNKIKFLNDRFLDIVNECLKRNFSLMFMDPLLTPIELKILEQDRKQQFYEPSIKDCNESLKKLIDKVNSKSGFYRFHKDLVNNYSDILSKLYCTNNGL
jgi:deoxyribonuclease (pyrimidine dimer)